MAAHGFKWSDLGFDWKEKNSRQMAKLGVCQGNFFNQFCMILVMLTKLLEPFNIFWRRTENWALWLSDSQLLLSQGTFFLSLKKQLFVKARISSTISQTSQSDFPSHTPGELWRTTKIFIYTPLKPELHIFCPMNVFSIQFFFFPPKYRLWFENDLHYTRDSRHTEIA